MTEIEVRKVRVKCLTCGKEGVTDLTFGLDERYPDDFSIDCPNCDNWEEGTLPLQGFDMLEELDRYTYMKEVKHDN